MHDHIQLCYVLSGTLRHIIDGKEYIQLPDSCAILLPYMQHMTDLVNSEDTPIVVFIFFEKDFLEICSNDLFSHTKYYNGHKIPLIREFETDEARKHIRALIDEFSIDGENDYHSIAKHISSIFNLACTERHTRFPNRITRNKIYDIERAVSHICEHYPEKLTIDELASFSNMSRSTFTTNFKSVTGLSFLDFLTSVRLSEALHFDSSATCDDVAAATGLHDRTNLTRVFKKHLGMTRNEFREFRKNNNAKPNPKSRTLLDWIYTDE